ncbi:hypothetical protein PROFUN_03134 [Planoprotostelium fungivorum]|uniref:Uncharacterized protein n=1 Tax=Planoprotostelium fungivorum TaxID=1890364 RepID=A0A2P6NQB4_9EUKA|nr:hypothetical protein PROFUN_03134 [Planoprotostelium fungivorum]
MQLSEYDMAVVRLREQRKGNLTAVSTKRRSTMSDEWVRNDLKSQFGDSCWTFHERFSGYGETEDMMHLNSLLFERMNQTSQRQTVLFRTDHRNALTPNATLHLQALLVESAIDSTMDFHIVMDVGDRPLTEEQFQKLKEEKMPPQFWPFVIQMDTNTVRNDYPLFRSNWNDGHAQLSLIARTIIPQYDFYWLVENDVRLIGSWADVFKEVKRQWTEAKLLEWPDVVNFNFIGPSGREWPLYCNIDNPYNGFNFLAGWSRRMMDDIKQWTTSNSFPCNIECVPNTLAVRSNRTLFITEIPQVAKNYTAKDMYDNGGTKNTFSWSGVAGDYWREFRDEKKCAKFTFVHPVKADAG